MGSKPERDPLEEVKSSTSIELHSNEIRWADREIRSNWEMHILTAGIMITLTIMNPLIGISVTLLCFLVALILPIIRKPLESKSLKAVQWSEFDTPDVSITPLEKTIQLRGTGGQRFVSMLTLEKTPTRLSGTLGKLLRAIDGSIGFSLQVSMKPVDITELLDAEHFPSYYEELLQSRESGELDSFVSTRGGIWKTYVSVTGIFNDAIQIEHLENAIRGSIPGPKPTLVPVSKLEKHLRDGIPFTSGGGFYSAGRELKGWLVQLSSELASEVGSSIPGQFISSIRSRPGDYIVGDSLNPDTLLTGPPLGFSYQDLRTGMLLCGGSWSERYGILTNLITEILNDNKRVLLVSTNQDILSLTGLHPEAIGLSLGRDFVLNPVDAEQVPRNEFVACVKTALEVVTETDLSSAADFELALSKAVAIGNSTVADVTLVTTNPEDIDSSTPTQDVSFSSNIAMDAIRIFHQGTGAQAFYGHQPLSIQRLSEQPLSIIHLSTGSIPLDMFAWDIFCTKFTGTIGDDLVVILDEPPNMLVNTSKYKKRLPWAIRVAQKLSNRASLILSINAPQVLPTGVIDTLSSCIALRLRSKYDIAVVSDLLGLSVISTGMHSKQRVSPRETSFLRVMEPGVALLARDDTEVCQPIKLREVSKSTPVSSDVMNERIQKLLTIDPIAGSSSAEKSLIDRVSGDNRDATLKVLKLLKQYEPLTEQAIRKFMSSSEMRDIDFEGILTRLEHSSMILRGHETHSGVSYTNYRVTMKGEMALKQMLHSEDEL
jgi:hypothetical protein